MLIASGDKRGFITSAGWVLREKGTGGSRQPVGATLPVFASRLFKMAGRTASVYNGEVAHYCTFRVMACSRSQPTVVYHRIMSYLDQAICAFSLFSTRVLEGREEERVWIKGEFLGLRRGSKVGDLFLSRWGLLFGAVTSPLPDSI